MSKRTLIALVLILGVIICVKGVAAKPEKAVPAYQIQQQDQGVETFKVQDNVSKI